MKNRLKYLKQSLDAKVFEYLQNISDNIPDKLLVWYGRELQRSYNNECKNKSNNNFILGFFTLNIDNFNEEERNYINTYKTTNSTQYKSNKNVFIFSGEDAIRNDIKDWFNGVRCNISEMTIETALTEAIRWHIDIRKNKKNDIQYTKLLDKDIIFEYQNYKIVNLPTNADCIVEGDKMGHCVGRSGYGKKLSDHYKIYSVRDERNEPHATMEIKIDGSGKVYVLQIKGKENKTPVLQYQPIILKWISTLHEGAIEDCDDIISFDRNQILEFDGVMWECKAEFYEYIGNKLINK